MKPPRRPSFREELEDYLASAPEGLRDWADEQLAALKDQGADVAEVLGEDAEEEPSTSTRRTAATRSSPQHRAGVSKVNLVLVALLAAAVVVIVQQAGAGGSPSSGVLPAGHPDIASTAMPTDLRGLDESVPVDPEREQELKAAIAADPADHASRQELGVMYIKAALYQQASTVLQEVLDAEPDNLDALLAIGLAEFQQNHFDRAEQSWDRAAEVRPEAAEPWYNLGFLHMAKTPPDPQRAQECWSKVLQLAPGSDMAANVREHQQRIGRAQPTAGPRNGG